MGSYNFLLFLPKKNFYGRHFRINQIFFPKKILAVNFHNRLDQDVKFFQILFRLKFKAFKFQFGFKKLKRLIRVFGSGLSLVRCSDEDMFDCNKNSFKFVFLVKLRIFCRKPPPKKTSRHR